MVLEVVGDTLYASQRPNSLHPLLTSVGIKSVVLKHPNLLENMSTVSCLLTVDIFSSQIIFPPDPFQLRGHEKVKVDR